MVLRFFESIRANKTNIMWSSVVFIASVTVGYIFINENNPFVNALIEEISKMADKLKADGSVLNMIITIFLNNLRAAFLMIFIGALLFGVYPIFAITMNGLLIGFFVKMVAEQSGHTFLFFLTGLLPHGILEIPAIIIAASLGTKLGVTIFKFIFQRRKRENNRKVLKQIIEKQLPITFFGVTIILFVAAIIESTLTVYLINKFYI